MQYQTTSKKIIHTRLTVIIWVAFREPIGYSLFVIKNFIHKGLEKFFTKGSKAGIQARHAKRIRLILAQLNQAGAVKDMDIFQLLLYIN